MADNRTDPSPAKMIMNQRNPQSGPPLFIVGQKREKEKAVLYK
jgi:hypothetical protein